MKATINFIKKIFSVTPYQTVCDSCSYYGDQIVDDNQAFVPHVTSKRGWVSKYVQDRLTKK